MRFFYLFFVVTVLFSTQVAFTQTEVESGAVMLYTDIEGIWENDGKIIRIQNSNNGTLEADITLKTFYTFYYDGTYPTGKNVPVNLVRIGNSLYLEYWEKGLAYRTLGDPILNEETPDPVFKVKIERPMKFDSSTAQPADGVLWLPKSNTTELSIDEVMFKEEVLAYYVDDTGTYKVRYWLTDAEYTDEKVELKLVESEIEESVYIDKYIKIGSHTYTSATGLRTEIRNVTSIAPFDNGATLNVDGTVLTFGGEYLTLSDITDVDEAIAFHNSIPRPPRNGLAKFVEPSIYKKLEEMTLEDFENTYSPNY